MFDCYPLKDIAQYYAVVNYLWGPYGKMLGRQFQSTEWMEVRMKHQSPNIFCMEWTIGW